MTTLSQRSFSGGELAPVLYARCDTVKHATALRQMRNFFTMKSGGAQNRPGTSFVGEVLDSTNPVRLVPFVFSNSQAYILEFGQHFIRVIQNGAYVTSNPASITNISQANPAVVTAPSHGFSNGDVILITGVYGMIQMNNRQFVVTAVTSTTFEVEDFWGNIINSTSFPAFVSGGGGLANKIFTITTPYATADLMALNFAQSADVMTIAHTSYPPKELHRNSQTNWTLVDVSAPVPDAATPVLIPNTSGMHNPAVSGDKVFYVVTQNDPKSFEESLQSNTISNASAATSTSSLSMEVSPSTGGITWNFYKGFTLNGPFGLVSRSPYPGYVDFGDTPDYTQQPPVLTSLFNSSNNYPGAVAYAQQRIWFGNSNNNPTTAWASQIGYFHNFTTSFPSSASDAITFTTVGQQVNRIKHFLSLTNLMIFTEAGEIACLGGGQGQLTPTTINPTQNSYNGSGDVPPIVIDNNCLYVQNLGSIVRDLYFDWQINGYHGNDITVFATHLFQGFTIVDWSYQKVPNQIVWAVRSDGIVLGCTYVKEQQILAWHRHDFQPGSIVENVACIPESLETTVYFVVKRTINGRVVRYIEQINTRLVTAIEDSVFMDSCLEYNGEGNGTSVITFSSPTGWTYTDTQIVTYTLAPFGLVLTSSNIGEQFVVTDPSDGLVTKFTIVSVTAGVATVKPNRTVSSALQTILLASTSAFSYAVKTLVGLYHLEGLAVSILGDGFVVASPNNSSLPVVTVTNGTITLPRAHVQINVGLPYIADLETLDIDVPQGETLVGKRMFVGKVFVQVDTTRGLFFGPKPPEVWNGQTDPLAGLDELKVREWENYPDPVRLLTGQAEVVMNAEWNNNGRIFLRQVDPLPATVIAIHAEGKFPIRQMGSP